MSDEAILELINKYAKLLSIYELLCALLMQISNLNKDKKIEEMINEFDDDYGIGKSYEFKLGEKR